MLAGLARCSAAQVSVSLKTARIESPATIAATCRSPTVYPLRDSCCVTRLPYAVDWVSGVGWLMRWVGLAGWRVWWVGRRTVLRFWRRRHSSATLPQRRRFSMGKRGLATVCNSKRWTKEAAEGVQFTVGNGYYVTILHRNQPEELSKRTIVNQVM